MEVGRHLRDVINDDNSHTHVSREILQKPNIGVEATG